MLRAVAADPWTALAVVLGGVLLLAILLRVAAYGQKRRYTRARLVYTEHVEPTFIGLVALLLLMALNVGAIGLGWFVLQEDTMPYPFNRAIPPDWARVASLVGYLLLALPPWFAANQVLVMLVMTGRRRTFILEDDRE